jgi:hypothetical protein
LPRLLFLPIPVSLASMPWARAAIGRKFALCS